MALVPSLLLRSFQFYSLEAAKCSVCQIGIPLLCILPTHPWVFSGQLESSLKLDAPWGPIAEKVAPKEDQGLQLTVNSN
jgi:hypothetical protein